MLPDLGVLLAALICAGLGAAVLLLSVGLRGTLPNNTRPPGRTGRALHAVQNPALARRIGAGLAVAVLVLLVTRWPVAAVGLGALVILWPVLFGGGQHERLQMDRLEALVVWTESLRDTVGAHASLEQAIPVTARHAPPLIRPALVRLVGQLHARVPIDKALLSLAAYLDDASADLVLAALILSAQRRGDGLGQVLTGLAVAAREELDVRRKVSAGRAGLRRGVQVVVVITLSFAGFLAVFGGTYVEPYATPAGQLALGVVLGIFAVGFGWMRQLSGIPAVPAFLTPPAGGPDPADLMVLAGLTGSAGAGHDRPGSQRSRRAR